MAERTLKANYRECAGILIHSIFGAQDIRHDRRWGQLQDAIEAALREAVSQVAQIGGETDLPYRHVCADAVGCARCNERLNKAIDKAVAQRDDEWRKPTPADGKYGRDHDERITMGALVAKVLAAPDREKFLDLLDSEFLLGCWGFALKEYPDPNLLRDLRGFIVEIVRQAVAQERQTLREWIQPGENIGHWSSQQLLAWLDSREKQG